MNTKQIVVEWLADHGYDGLANEECGCGLGDFAPCMSGPYPECEAAMARVATEDDDLHDLRPGDTLYVPVGTPRSETAP